MNNKMVGVGISYLLIIIDIVVGILFVPFLLKTLGDTEYGIYKLMLSTASYLSVLDFGIGGTITRYVVKFKTQNNRKDEENFLAMGFLIYGILSLLVILLAGGITFAIPKMYAVSIPSDRIAYAQLLFILICSNTAVTLFNHAFNGLLLAYERFTYEKALGIIRVTIRVLLLIALIFYIKLSLVIAIVDLLLSLLQMIINYFYCTKKLGCRIKLHGWDWPLAKEAGVFTTAILAQAIINQFNSNVDNIVLGIYVSAAVISMYSLALQLYTMYNCLSTAVSSVYLPSLSSAVFKGESDEEITERIIKPSRVQLSVLLFGLTGFILFGRHFIRVWVGPQYMQVYTLGYILLTTATIELSQNTITAILKAKSKLHGKTFILALSTLANIILTFALVPRMGAIGAVIGTAFSLLFGYGLALNLYYHFKININMITYYKKTYKGILPAAIIACVIGIPINLYINVGGWIGFIVKALIYSIVYLTAIYFIGLNSEEKNMIIRIIKKYKK